MNALRKVISTSEAAKALGRGRDTVERSLRNGTFPIGTCFKTTAGRFVYIIPEDAFKRFLNGEIDRPER